MSSQFSELYEKTIQNFEEGEVVKGKVVAIRGREVIIDIGYKAEGILNISEFTDPSEVFWERNSTFYLNLLKMKRGSSISPKGRPTVSARGMIF